MSETDGESPVKQAIFDAALRLFSARGYNAVGVAEIAAEACITKPTLYYYFGSKEGLFAALLREHYEILNGRLTDAAHYEACPNDYHADVYPVLRNVARVYFSFAVEHNSFMLMALSLAFSPESAVETGVARPFSARQYEILIDLFRAMSAVHGNLRGKEHRLARYFIALIHSAITFHANGFGALDDESAHELVRQFMHGIFA